MPPKRRPRLLPSSSPSAPPAAAPAPNWPQPPGTAPPPDAAPRRARRPGLALDHRQTRLQQLFQHALRVHRGVPLGVGMAADGPATRASVPCPSLVPACRLQCARHGRLPATHRLPDRRAHRGACTRWAKKQRIVGISGFTVRPARARQEKPRVSAFTSAKVDRILALQPDLAIGFSDMQADIARALILRRRGGVDQQPPLGRRHLGLCAAPGRDGRRGRQGACLCRRACARMSRRCAMCRIAAAPAARVLRGMGRAADQRHPLGQRAAATSPAATTSSPSAPPPAWASDRIVADPQEVVRAAPDIVIGSWCGKKFRPERVAARAGLGRGAGGARRRTARDQVAADPAARPGGADRRARCAACDRRTMGRQATS